MQYLTCISLIVFLLVGGCSNQSNSDEFDYSGYTRYKLNKLHMLLQVPNNMKPINYDHDDVDSARAIPFEERTKWPGPGLLSILYDQAKGKIVHFSSGDSLHDLYITSFHRVELNKANHKQLIKGMKLSINQWNEEMGLDLKLLTNNRGKAGKVYFSEFIIKSEVNNAIAQVLVVTLNKRSWCLQHFGESTIDFIPILSSIRFPKRT